MVRKSLSTLVLITLSLAAKADDWGCQVLLCLANPAGAMAESACIPPITKLFNALNKFHPDPFPSCESANGAAVAKQGFNYFNACPAGTTDLPAGALAIQMSRPAFKSFSTFASQANVDDVKTGIGSGEGNQLTNSDGGVSIGIKVCVAKELGNITIRQSQNYDDALTVTAFEQVVTLAPNASPRYIDVLIDGKAFTRSRY